MNYSAVSYGVSSGIISYSMQAGTNPLKEIRGSKCQVKEDVCGYQPGELCLKELI
jgi:hypothetical protein